MDLFSSQHSPVSDPDVPPLLTLPPSYSSTIIKSEPMSVWPYSDPRPYTPQVIDNTNIVGHTDLEGYSCPDTLTYLSLTPAEIDAAGPVPFTVASDFLNYEYKPTFLRMDDELFMNNNKDEGYVSPTASLHSLTPPADLRQLTVRDSANESGNSNDLTGIYETDVHPQQFRLSDSCPSPPQPPRTQCVKCGSVVDIAQCLKEATGHYLCFSCHMQSSSALISVPAPEPVQRRTRKKQATSANARNQICQNCECPNTTLWRRSFSGEAVCNACGLYEKLHKRKRPKSMRKDTIQTRRRKPRSAEAKKKAVVETTTSISNTSSSVISSRVISQPMVVPPHPPPPYTNNRYLTIEDNGNYVLPPMGSLGFLNTFSYDSPYSHFPAQ